MSPNPVMTECKKHGVASQTNMYTNFVFKYYNNNKIVVYTAMSNNKQRNKNKSKIKKKCCKK